jgi:hypothetical protein
MSMTRVLKWLIALNVLALAVTGAIYIGGRFAAERARQEEVRRIGKDFETEGTMTQAEYVRIRDIQDGVNKSGEMSDTDFAWVLDLLGRRQKPLAQARGLLTISTLRPFPPDRREQAFSAAKTSLLAKDPADTDGLRPVYAFRVFKAMRDQRSIALMLPWLDDSRAIVKRRAAETLSAMGYAVKDRS